MARLEDFQRDYEQIEKGAWAERIPGAGDVRVFTRGMDCVDAIMMKAELESNRPMEVIRDPGKSALADIHDNAKIVAHVCAQKVEGIEDFTVPESKDEFEKILLDPKNRPLLSLFLSAARLVGRLQKAKKEELEKNSEAGTDGN